MKFIVSSGQLLRALQTVSGVIQSNNTLPILDHFLVHLDPGKLTITASDLETTMTTHLSVDSSESTTAAIPARMLLDTVKSFPEQPLTFTLNPASHALEVSSDFGKYALAYVDAAEYPRQLRSMARTVSTFPPTCSPPRFTKPYSPQGMTTSAPS
jgi:DNA polymerase-3 subunit beta